MKIAVNETPAFHNKDGWLSLYGLGCGYIEVKDEGGIRTTLWMEGGVYHVRQHDFNTHERVFWDVFDSVTEARERFKEATRG